MLSDLLYRLRAWLRPGRADRDLADELSFHQHRETEKLEARGFDAVEAHRRARVAFGGSSATAEACRDARGIRWLDETSKDIRYAIRGFLRTPLFTLTVAASLVLGVGLNATMFTLMQAALWRPLPVPAPEEVFHVRRAHVADAPGRESSFSYVLFRDLRDAAGPAAEVVAKRSPIRRRFGLTPDSKERVIGDAVSDRWFGALGVRPAVGRLLAAGDDDLAGGRAVAVLSHRFWTTRFQADPLALGRTIYYDEVPFTVVGVAETGFSGVDAETLVDVWVPLTADPAIAPKWLVESSVHWLTLMARLRDPGAAPAVESALDGRFRTHLTAEILPTLPTRFRTMLEGEHVQLRPARAGLATTGRRHQAQLLVLSGIAVAVFLICCANIANIVRARHNRRAHEFALRRALGAGRARIIRQLVTEGMLLGGIAATGSLVVAPWTAQLLLHLVPGSQRTGAPTLSFDLGPDLTILAVTGALGIVGALVAVTLPAWRSAKAAGALGAGVRVVPRMIGGKTMVAAQLSMVLVLLVVAGLCLTTVRRLQNVGLGFDPTSVMVIDPSFSKKTPDARAAAAFERIRENLATVPGISAVTYAFPEVYDEGGTSMGIVPDGHVAMPGEDTEAGVVVIGPGFFETLRIPLREGRIYEAYEILNPGQRVVVNERFARKYFAGQSAIGKRLRVPSPAGPVFKEIIGVVGDARHYGVRADPWPMVYTPFGSQREARLLVRSEGPLSIASLQATIEQVDTSVQVESIRPLSDSINELIGSERLLASLSSVVAGLAVVLAALGLYGVVAHGVSCRAREFGVRLALGASPRDIQGLVFRETMTLAVMGACAGILAAIVAARLMSSLVSDSAPLDWQTGTTATLLLLVVAGVAGWVPAWRASRSDPATTLRAE